MKKLFVLLMVSVLFISCGETESSFIEVKDWNSEASVREAMQGKWYTSQRLLSSSEYSSSGGSGWERRLLIEGNTVTAWSKTNADPEWVRIGSGELKLGKHQTDALSEISSSHRAIEWVFDVDFEEGSFESYTLRYEKDSGGVNHFRKGDYDIYKGWNH